MLQLKTVVKFYAEKKASSLTLDTASIATREEESVVTLKKASSFTLKKASSLTLDTASIATLGEESVVTMKKRREVLRSKRHRFFHWIRQQLPRWENNLLLLRERREVSC